MLLRDSPGDLQWGVKGAPFHDTAQTMITGAFSPKRRRSSVALFGPFSAVFKRFRHRLTNPPRSAPRDFERRESDRLTHLSQIRGRKAVAIPADFQRQVAQQRGGRAAAARGRAEAAPVRRLTPGRERGKPPREARSIMLCGVEVGSSEQELVAAHQSLTDIAQRRTPFANDSLVPVSAHVHTFVSRCSVKFGILKFGKYSVYRPLRIARQGAAYRAILMRQQARGAARRPTMSSSEEREQ
eukprot:scaffold49847_cov62-Phaeocystis_antarctica.AAC.1